MGVDVERTEGDAGVVDEPVLEEKRACLRRGRGPPDGRDADAIVHETAKTTNPRMVTDTAVTLCAEDGHLLLVVDGPVLEEGANARAEDVGRRVAGAGLVAVVLQ